MRWLSCFTIMGLALLAAWAVPSNGQAQGQAPPEQRGTNPPAKGKEEPLPAPEGANPPAAPKPGGTANKNTGPYGGYRYGYSAGNGGYLPGAPNSNGTANSNAGPYGGYGYGSGYSPGLYGYYGPYSYRPGGIYGMYGPYGPYRPPAQPSPPSPPTGEAEVRICDNYFDPAIVYVTPGGTIRWKNEGQHKHTITGFTGHWGSSELLPGQSYTFTVPRALNHFYYDRNHRLEMTGVIVIRAQPQDRVRYRPSWAY